MQQLKGKLTYANVIATMALFLALSGGVAWAAHKIGANQLKSNSVGTGKIKKNAVTATKIKKLAITNTKLANGAVSNAKLADGAVSFAKIAAGTNVVGTATGGPVAANIPTTATAIPLTGTTTFTPQAGSVYLLSVEAKGNLARTGAESCTPEVIPFVNGNRWDVAEGALEVRAFAPTANEPSGSRPVSGETGLLGLTSPGLAQTISAKVVGDVDCTANSTVSVALAITQLK
jgi:hypothetical protein